MGEQVPALERLGPVEFVAARFVPVALFCLAWFFFLPTERLEARKILAERGALVLGLGLLNVWGYNLAFAAGHHRVPAGTGSLFTVLNPVLTFVLAVALGHERARWSKVAGIALAFSGLYTVVIYGSGRAVEAAYLRDALLLLGAPLSWSLFTVLSKPLLGRYRPLTLNFLVLGLASLPALGFAVVSTPFHAKVAAWGAERHLWALFLALVCTLLGFWLWYEALKRVPATTAAAFVFLNAPLTVAFDRLWFGHVPRSAWVLGCALVLAGVWISTREAAPTSPAVAAPRR